MNCERIEISDNSNYEDQLIKRQNFEFIKYKKDRIYVQF